MVGPLSLALSKLLFQAQRKREAFALTADVFNSYTGPGCRGGVTADEAAEAYQVSFISKNPDFLLRKVDFLLKNPDFIIQLGGWIKIHSDDHMSAYDIWSRGHRVVPACAFLARQARRNMTNCVFKTRDYAFKTRDCVFKTRDFVFQMMIPRAPGRETRLLGRASQVMNILLK